VCRSVQYAWNWWLDAFHLHDATVYFIVCFMWPCNALSLYLLHLFVSFSHTVYFGVSSTLPCSTHPICERTPFSQEGHKILTLQCPRGPITPYKLGVPLGLKLGAPNFSQDTIRNQFWCHNRSDPSFILGMGRIPHPDPVGGVMDITSHVLT